jgi:hypothetical protein
MNILRKLAMVIAVLIAPLAANAEAITLFDNGAFSGFQEQSRNNMCALFGGDGTCISRFTIYDQFVLDTDSTITGITWHQTEQSPGNYMGTLLTIGTGTPSETSLLHTLLVTADRVLIQIPNGDPRFNSMPDGSFEALASVSDLEIVLDEGQYWLGIHNMYPQFGGSSQWSQTLGTNQTIAGRWQGEGQVCGAFPTGPDGGCLKFFPGENSAFSIIGRIDVVIDIKPGKTPNSINLTSGQKIPVAILTTDDFDATQVDPSTVTFGPDEAMEVHKASHIKDVDEDGDMDVLLHFDTAETGIACGDTEATLTGATFDGEAITGTDSVNTVNCPAVDTTIKVLIGDKDCFGLGGVCSDGDRYVEDLGGVHFADNREPGEPLGVDHWGTRVSLDGPSFDIGLDLGGATPSSALFTIFIAGLEHGATFSLNGSNIGTYESGDNTYVRCADIFVVRYEHSDYVCSRCRVRARWFHH